METKDLREKVREARKKMSSLREDAAKQLYTSLFHGIEALENLLNAVEPFLSSNAFDLCRQELVLIRHDAIEDRTQFLGSSEALLDVLVEYAQTAVREQRPEQQIMNEIAARVAVSPSTQNLKVDELWSRMKTLGDRVISSCPLL